MLYGAFIDELETVRPRYARDLQFPHLAARAADQYNSPLSYPFEE
jgi:hypothetical protein